MDNVWLESGTLSIGYICPKCGHEGHQEVEAMIMQGVCLEVRDHPCEECGHDVFEDYDEEDDYDED